MTSNRKQRWSWLPRPINNIREDKARPVFITGAPRCGSSWVGEVLGNCNQTRYVYEPFNFQWVPALGDQLRHFRYFSNQSDTPPLLQHIADGAFRGRQGWKQMGRAAYRGYLGAASRTATRVVIKDPTASLMADWITRRFHAQILIVVRHPCGFASSLETLGWSLNVNTLLRQKELMLDHLSSFEDTLRHAKNDKWLTRGAIWGALHTVFARQLERHADWRLLRYEDLCDDPVRQYGTLAQKLQLELSHHTRQRINALSTGNSSDSGSTRRDSRSMPDRWRQRVSPAQTDAVMGVVDEFGLNYYTK